MLITVFAVRLVVITVTPLCKHVGISQLTVSGLGTPRWWDPSVIVALRFPGVMLGLGFRVWGLGWFVFWVVGLRFI